MPSAAVQFNGSPPLLVTETGWETVPVITLIVRPGPAVSAGGAKTLSVTPTVCGLPVIAMPPSTAASEIEPVYDPAASAADVTVTVKVAPVPLATVAGAGDTASQPVPVPIVTVGVMATAPRQPPITPIVKVCAAGFEPASVVKVSPATEGSCRVHAGCTVSVTAIVCGVPTAVLVTLLIAVMVIVPEYVPAVNPASTTPTLVAEGVVKPTIPVAGVVVSHVPPAGVVETAAVQFKAFAQAPLAPMVAGCVTGLGCPITPWKASAGGVAAIVQGACTTKVTGMDCGLPAAGFPGLTVPVIVIVPL